MDCRYSVTRVENMQLNPQNKGGARVISMLCVTDNQPLLFTKRPATKTCSGIALLVHMTTTLRDYLNHSMPFPRWKHEQKRSYNFLTDSLAHKTIRAPLAHQ